MGIHCLIKTLALGYCMILLCILFRIFAPSDISEGGGFSNGERASTSTEEDEVMEGRMEEDIADIAGGHLIQCQEDILEETSGMRAKIDGGYSIQCQEDVLESAENLARSRQTSSDLIVSGGLTQCNKSRRLIECHLMDDYMDLHPDIPIRSILIDQDQQNREAHQQVDRPVQASLDNNIPRNPVQVTDDTSSSGFVVAEVTGLNVPGTESEHTPMHSHGPFDGGTEISEHVQDGDQDDSGGVPNTDEFVRSIRGTLCIVCKKNTVEIKFETCGHAVCCLQCASDMQQCNVCHKTIMFKSSIFI